MRAVGIVFSNIHDKEIKELTDNRTLASVPFGGRYRLIDFVLSNFVNSDITKVGIITKENYQSLMDHIGSGKNWDLSRKNGGLIVLPPYGTGGTQLYQSRFEAVKNIENFIKRSEEEYVVMSDCDNVCNFDFMPALEQHSLTNADITVIYRKNNINDESTKKTRISFEISKDNRVTNAVVSDKLDGQHYVHTNMLIINRRLLLNIIENSKREKIRSFTHDIITQFDKYRIYGYEHKGYFASIESMTSYYKHSIELLEPCNREMLFNNNGAQIFTKVRDSAPLRLKSTSKVSNSLIADGCVIEGEVKNSILFRGVKVGKGALIENSIIFQDTIIGEGTRLNCVIADKQAEILDNRLLSGHSTQPYFIAKGKVI